MANKTTKQLRQRISQACKAKQPSVVHSTPVFNYHSHSGSKESFFVNVEFPTAIVKGGVNSTCARRNMRQRILINEDSGGVKSSVTCHEPIDAKRFNVPKNHNYLAGAYRQTVQTSSRPAVV